MLFLFFSAFSPLFPNFEAVFPPMGSDRSSFVGPVKQNACHVIKRYD